jgi:hypothetical protein
VPVVSIHTLGDLFVPFSMQQVYKAPRHGQGQQQWLVQRAIRGASHCDFTVEEQVEAFEAMVKWERDGIKPSGDDVVTAATVAAPTYGCTYTIDTLGRRWHHPRPAGGHRPVAAGRLRGTLTPHGRRYSVGCPAPAP